MDDNIFDHEQPGEVIESNIKIEETVIVEDKVVITAQTTVSNVEDNNDKLAKTDFAVSEIKTETFIENIEGLSLFNCIFNFLYSKFRIRNMHKRY